MPEPSSRLWELRDFETFLDAWIHTEHPEQEVVLEVAAWILSRMDDPYQGVTRQPDTPDYWHGRIPGTDRGDTSVYCAYYILVAEHAVRCDIFGTLNRPV